MPADASYRPGPRVERNVVTGNLSASQVIILGAGSLLGLAVLVVDPLPSLGMIPLSVVAFMGIVGLAGTAAFVPVRGLLIADWTPQVMSHTGRRARGRSRWHSPAHGHGVALSRHGELEHLEVLPAEFGDLQIVSVDCPQGPVGMIHDRRAGTLCACSRLHPRSLGLLGYEDQVGRYTAFGRILDSLAPELTSDPDSRVQLLKRVVPRRVNELAEWLAVNVEDPECEQAQDLWEVAAAGGNEREHELFVIIRQGVRSAYRARDRAAQLRESGLLLASRLVEVDGQLRDAEIALGHPERLLDEGRLARLIKDQVDPFDRTTRDMLEQQTGLPGVDPRDAWPDFCDEQVGFWRADSADHVSWWIKGWPTRTVKPGWLKPLLLSSSAILNVSLVLKPVDEEVAIRQARAHLVAEETSRRTRQRAQQVERQAHRDSQEQAARKEEEVGVHSVWRWEANLSASVPAGDVPARLEAVKRVRQACVRSHLKPVLMYCAHERTFMRTLPFARGLRDR